MCWPGYPRLRRHAISCRVRRSGNWSGVTNSTVLMVLAADSSKWVPETGGDGWGNHELEYYTDRPKNVTCREWKSRDQGAARKIHRLQTESHRDYTSARMKTQGKFSQAYGRFEARIRIPRRQGIWPAFWMLGDDIDKVGWPECGEIDIMENIGKEPSTRPRHDPRPGILRREGIGSAVYPAERAKLRRRFPHLRSRMGTERDSLLCR